jgi:hypothetical protein
LLEWLINVPGLLHQFNEWQIPGIRFSRLHYGRNLIQRATGDAGELGNLVARFAFPRRWQVATAVAKVTSPLPFLSWCSLDWFQHSSNCKNFCWRKWFTIGIFGELAPSNFVEIDHRDGNAFPTEPLSRRQPSLARNQYTVRSDDDFMQKSNFGDAAGKFIDIAELFAASVANLYLGNTPLGIRMSPTHAFSCMASGCGVMEHWFRVW